MENISGLLFLLIATIIICIVIEPFAKEYDKRKAEDRLAKKIADEMSKKQNENSKEG